MKRLFTYIFAVALSVAGCEQNCEVDNIQDFELSHSEFEATCDGGTLAVKVTSKLNWTADADADWIMLRAADIESVDGRKADSGFAASVKKPFNFDTAGGFVDIEINIAANDFSEDRMGHIIFNTSDKRTFSLSIAQKGDPTGIPDDMELAFPDPVFRKYVLTNFDTDKNGKISKEEAEAVTKIDVDNFDNYYRDESKCIKSLEGIQYFTNLTYLDCQYNQLTTLDISKNTQLTYLNCDWNKLSTLDVCKNTLLRDLSCDTNQLTTLDVSKNTQLIYLECGGNKLTALDMSNNIQLTELRCYSNQLMSLDVSKNTQLKTLYCNGNQLTTLNMSGCTQLTELYCNYNQLTALDVSKNTQLERWFCYSNQLTSLNVSNNTQLEDLWCYSNQLTSLDVSNNTQLTSLWCYNNSLTTLDVSKTNLGNSTSSIPLYCAPMETLKTLYLKKGWSIKGITEDNGRSTDYIPEQTEIIFID